jgi:dipeptidyl aminopeptidase/acylaminoacyl peptidase
MYQALKSVGTPTRLVIYPGQFHGITRPSYRRHRLEQWIQWFDTYVKGAPATTPRQPTPTTSEAR